MRRRAVGIALAALFLVFAGDGAGPARAYLLSQAAPNEGPFFHGNGRESKERWQPEVWGPGMTMLVEVPDDARWLEAPGIGSMADARALVERALAFWRGVDTADIRWRLRRPGDEDEGRVRVAIEQVGDIRALTSKSITADADGIHGYFRCRVGLDEDEFPTRDLFYLLVHELGHCLGPTHGGRHPNARWWRGRDGRLPNPLWGADGPMASTNLTPTMSFDEQVAVSLLWPRRGWLETTGALYGSVLGEGELGPQLFVNVLAARIGAGGSLVGPVQAPTSEFGHFVIEGLDPGLYVLMVYSMGMPDPWRERTEGFREAVRLAPVEVRAGERTGPIVLTIRPGEGLD